MDKSSQVFVSKASMEIKKRQNKKNHISYAFISWSLRLFSPVLRSVHPWDCHAGLWIARSVSPLRAVRSQEVRIQEICSRNWVGDSEDQAHHEVRELSRSGQSYVKHPEGQAESKVKNLAGSEIQEVRPEPGWVSRGSGSQQGQEGKQVRYPRNPSVSSRTSQGCRILATRLSLAAQTLHLLGQGLI